MVVIFITFTFVISNSIWSQEVLFHEFLLTVIRNDAYCGNFVDNSISVIDSKSQNEVCKVEFCNGKVLFTEQNFSLVFRNEKCSRELVFSFRVIDVKKTTLYNVCIDREMIIDSRRNGRMYLRLYDFELKRNKSHEKLWKAELSKHANKSTLDRLTYSYDLSEGEYVTIPHLPYSLLPKDSVFVFGMIKK